MPCRIFIYRDQLSDEDLLALQTEIEILMQVDHPNIVCLQDVYEDEEEYSLVMEYMTGGEVSLFGLFFSYILLIALRCHS